MVLQSARTKLQELRSLRESFERWSLRCADLESVGEETAEGDEASNMAPLEAAVGEAKQKEEESLAALRQGLLDESRQRRELQSRIEQLLNAIRTVDTTLHQLQRAVGRKGTLNPIQIWMKRSRQEERKAKS